MKNATGSRAAVYRTTLTIPADDTTRDDHRPIRTRTPREIIAALCGFGDPGELEYVEEPLDGAAEPQAQDSLLEQMRRVHQLALENGEWDAADAIARHFLRKPIYQDG